MSDYELSKDYEYSYELPAMTDGFAIEQSLDESGKKEIVIALWPFGNEEDVARQKGKIESVSLKKAMNTSLLFAALFAVFSILANHYLFGRLTLLIVPFLLGIPGLCAYLILRDAAYIRIYKWGLKFEWVLAGKVVKEQQLYWKLLRSVELVTDHADFFGRTKPIVRFATRDGVDFDIKLENIPGKEVWLLFLKAAREWGSSAGITIDERILSSFSEHEKEESYTELWLEALTAAPERSRLQPLEEGAYLDVGKYQILRQIAAGGQGIAYLAKPTDPRSEEVVLKEYILPVYVDVKARRYALDRFTSETTMLKSLNHPNIVKLVDFFVEDQRAYIVEEYVKGNSLRKLVENSGAMAQATVIDLALVMCDILAYLHGCSPPVVHRDFTPDNLIVDSRGRMKVIDFTVAQRGEPSAVSMVVGKQAYLPPEQFRGKATTQSDIYAFGGTLYFLLVGEDPLPLSQSRPKLIRPEIDPYLDRLVTDCTALETQQRFLRIEDVKNSLESLKRRN